MSGATTPSNGINLQVIISIAGLILILFGGGWTLFQTQFSYIAKQVEDVRFIANDNSTRLAHEQEVREQAITSRLQAIQADLIRDRQDYINQAQFASWQSRVTDTIEVLRKQLSVLEATRPTTGEIQAAIRAIEARLNSLEVGKMVPMQK